MLSANSQVQVPGLLGKLGVMTSIRDTELLEQSLLRSLGPLLGVLDTSLYRLDDYQKLARVIHYHRSREVEGDGMARMVERIEIVRGANVQWSGRGLAGTINIITQASRTWLLSA